MTKILDVALGDGFDRMKRLPADFLRLIVTSPPYEDARHYKGNHKRRAEEWVRWYRPFVVEACRCSRLVAVNMSARVRDWRYSAAVEFLVADLIRLDGLQVGPAPYAWVKSSGIPGSGQAHYHRRDWEPIYVFARPENLPPAVTHNVALGAPPKWAPGGEMSNRLSSGERRNEWGFTKTSNHRRQGDGKRVPRVAGWSPRGHLAGGDLKSIKGYVPPKTANPGNVVYTLEAGKLSLCGDVLYTLNGGGNIGNAEAHGNVAPMNLAIAERFVLWFSDPGDWIGDFMMGSGTTGEAALRWNRRFWGVDEDRKEVERTLRRLAGVTAIGDRPRVVEVQP